MAPSDKKEMFNLKEYKVVIYPDQQYFRILSTRLAMLPKYTCSIV